MKIEKREIDNPQNWWHLDEDQLFTRFFESALQGSATTAATRHDTQAVVLVKKAIEIAKEAVEQLKHV